MDAKSLCLTVLLTLGLALCGCQPQAATPPVNVTALVKELDNLQQELATLMAPTTDDGADAEEEPTEMDIKEVASESHQMLHRVGAILAKLGKLQSHPDFSDEQCAEIAKQANKLGDAYGQLDTAIHDGDVLDYASVEDTITESMAALRKTTDAADAPAS